MKTIDLKTELNALGITFGEIGFIKAPAYPYGIFLDDEAVNTPDDAPTPRIITHAVTIELYHSSLPTLRTAGKKIEAWIEGYQLDYQKNTRYVREEEHYLTTYTFGYVTKRKD